MHLAGAMRQALREVDPEQPAQLIATMDHLVALTTAEPLFQTRLLSAFSLLALLLAARRNLWGSGLFGGGADSRDRHPHGTGSRRPGCHADGVEAHAAPGRCAASRWASPAPWRQPGC